MKRISKFDYTLLSNVALEYGYDECVLYRVLATLKAPIYIYAKFSASLEDLQLEDCSLQKMEYYWTFSKVSQLKIEKSITDGTLLVSKRIKSFHDVGEYYYVHWDTKLISSKFNGLYLKKAWVEKNLPLLKVNEAYQKFSIKNRSFKLAPVEADAISSLHNSYRQVGAPTAESVLKAQYGLNKHGRLPDTVKRIREKYPNLIAVFQKTEGIFSPQRVGTGKKSKSFYMLNLTTPFLSFKTKNHL